MDMLRVKVVAPLNPLNVSMPSAADRRAVRSGPREFGWGPRGAQGPRRPFGGDAPADGQPGRPTITGQGPARVRDPSTSSARARSAHRAGLGLPTDALPLPKRH